MLSMNFYKVTIREHDWAKRLHSDLDTIQTIWRPQINEATNYDLCTSGDTAIIGQANIMRMIESCHLIKIQEEIWTQDCHWARQPTLFLSNALIPWEMLVQGRLTHKL